MYYKLWAKLLSITQEYRKRVKLNLHELLNFIMLCKWQRHTVCLDMWCVYNTCIHAMSNNVSSTDHELIVQCVTVIRTVHIINAADGMKVWQKWFAQVFIFLFPFPIVVYSIVTFLHSFAYTQANQLHRLYMSKSCTLQLVLLQWTQWHSLKSLFDPVRPLLILGASPANHSWFVFCHTNFICNEMHECYIWIWW